MTLDAISTEENDDEQHVRNLMETHQENDYAINEKKMLWIISYCW